MRRRSHVHLTNVETVRDMTHGLAISRTRHQYRGRPRPDAEAPSCRKPGTYWYYCTWFCSALHLEMRGRMLVKAQRTSSKRQHSIQPPQGKCGANRERQFL